MTAGPDRHKPRPLAVITGASSGIGAEFARAFAARGYDLLLTARRRDRLEDLAQKLGAAHPIAAGIAPADLRLTEEAERLAERISQESRLEVLVNNAGFGLLGDFPATRIDDQIAMYQVHVLAPVRLTHAALPGMLARNRGGIINVASVAGFARVPGHASYNATKSWMIAFTECLHLELRRSGSAVRIQALCPGYTYTEFHDVLGLDRRQVMPGGAFWMPAEFVVAESLEALDKGAWLVVPGWRYKVLVWLLNTVPRAILDRAGSLLARRREQAAERFAAEGQAKPPRKT